MILVLLCDKRREAGNAGGYDPRIKRGGYGESRRNYRDGNRERRKCREGKSHGGRTDGEISALLERLPAYV